MIRSAGLFLVVMAVLAGCSSASITQAPPSAAASQTPIIADISPSANASKAAPTDAATGTPSAAPTPAPTASPTPKVTPAPTPTPAPTATPTPVATPTSRAQACSGTADHKAFFAEAAAVLTFDVYCAVLPSGWWFHAASYTAPSGGYLEVSYASASANFTVREGRDCPPAKACVAHGAHIGAASFGGQSGELYLSNTVYSLVVSSARPYVMYGSGMTQAKFVSLAAAFVKVPKS